LKESENVPYDYTIK